jgi:hypothetical protein
MEKNYQEAPVSRELTFGEKAVGLTFNPGKNEKVESIKRKFADLIDELHSYKVGPNEEENREADAMLIQAIRECQSAQMWAVKAVTWQY